MNVATQIKAKPQTELKSELKQLEFTWKPKWKQNRWFRTNSFAIVLLFVCALYCIFIAIVFTVQLFFNFFRRCALLTRIAIVLLLYCYCNAFVLLCDFYGIGNQIESNRIRIKIKVGANWFRTKSNRMNGATQIKANRKLNRNQN